MTSEFPPSHIIEPAASHTHTHTIILLHGRGSNGSEFAEELFSSSTSSSTCTSSSTQRRRDLASHFPNCRWVFPTSRDRWSVVFEEDMSSWFDIKSLTNPYEEKDQDIQINGLRESTLHFLGIVEREIQLLDGRSERVVLGGMSQGMATGLWGLLCSPAWIEFGNNHNHNHGDNDTWNTKKEFGFGGFIGACGWLPFANRIEEKFLSLQSDSGGSSVPDNNSGVQLTVTTTTTTNTTAAAATTQANKQKDLGLRIPELLLDIIKYEKYPAQIDTLKVRSMLTSTTPILLLHGTDDAFVDFELGQRARRNLVNMGFQVDWNEYSGAENDGHWIKEPEGFDAIVGFLHGVLFSAE